MYAYVSSIFAAAMIIDNYIINDNFINMQHKQHIGALNMDHRTTSGEKALSMFSSASKGSQIHYMPLPFSAGMLCGVVLMRLHVNRPLHYIVGYYSVRLKFTRGPEFKVSKI